MDPSHVTQQLLQAGSAGALADAAAFLRRRVCADGSVDGKDGNFDFSERQWAGLIEWAGAVGTVTNTLIPLPPLAEQAAIVARVEALMTTCRALEAEIEQACTHAAHFLQAVLKEVFAPAGSIAGAATNEMWARPKVRPYISLHRYRLAHVDEPERPRRDGDFDPLAE
jgi:hypothetical protein